MYRGYLLSDHYSIVCEFCNRRIGGGRGARDILAAYYTTCRDCESKLKFRIYKSGDNWFVDLIWPFGYDLCLFSSRSYDRALSFALKGVDLYNERRRNANVSEKPLQWFENLAIQG